MKSIIILGDGMADYPVPELGGKTPLMAANTPAMDWIAKKGQTGLFETIAPDMATGSAVANLSVLGYDPRTTFQGRGVLEAASMGVSLSENDMAMRVNLVCIENKKMKSHSAGHITNPEACKLIEALQPLAREMGFKIVQGLSYRHLLILPDGNADVECNPPHDYVGHPIEELWVKPKSNASEETAEKLNDLIKRSWEVLSNHPVNQTRMADGKLPANSLWPWSPGYKPQMQTFKERFGITGAVISAVDLIKGLGVYAGLDVINVEGATGLYDTNFEGKADAALEAIRTHDFVYVHVEAADEAGHDKNLKLKIQCIEDLDQRLIQRIIDNTTDMPDELILSVLPDHPTPVSSGIHVRDPIPVAVWNPALQPDAVDTYNEESVKNGSLGLLKGDQFINHALGNLKR